MNNEDKWRPSKFVTAKGTFRTTSDPSKAGLGHRLIGDLQAKHYSRLIKEHASGVLLDLGCGEAPLYEMYRPWVEKIICVDWSKTVHDALFLDFLADLNQPLPIRGESFDTILLTDVLEHIAEPGLLWREMARILKPGGRLVLTVPFFHMVHEEPHDYYRYTEYRLKRFCQENRLKVIELYPYGGSLEVVLDIVAKHISFSKTLSRIHIIIGQLLMNSVLGRKIYARTAAKYPLGYCLVAEK